MIGNDEFPASLLDLPAVVESFKTYDDCALVKTADIGQMIMVREPGDPAPNTVEYRHGLTPPMKDARKRRFRREPDLNPELVQRVERDLLNILSGGTVENVSFSFYFRHMMCLYLLLGFSNFIYLNFFWCRYMSKRNQLRTRMLVMQVRKYLLLHLHLLKSLKLLRQALVIQQELNRREVNQKILMIQCEFIII
jgi:transcription initiation factor TFIID subunit 7